MAGMLDEERRFAEAMSEFAFANPFQKGLLEQRLARALELATPLRLEGEPGAPPVASGRPELDRPLAASALLLSRVVDRLGRDKTLTPTEFKLYQDLVLVVLYYRFRDRFQSTIEDAKRAPTSNAERSNRVEYYDEFERAWRCHWDVLKDRHSPDYRCAHTFACLFLIRRAYYHIQNYLWGDSAAIEDLRAQVWQSVFSHDFRRYGVLLYDRMEDVTTLIHGASGTGKELVARAIGLSRYIPFDAKSMCFQEDFFDAFHPVNISALAATIVESELFGHAKGAFTDAIRSRAGIFELCKRGHTVFLDEIGELSASMQVKLLRVLQNREFQRVGETRRRSFGGKLIVATNRDFEKELASGSFREDLYYRLCSDVIVTPTLAEQVQGDPTRIRALAERIAFRQLANAEAATAIASDTVAWMEGAVGFDYEWPGNFRELEQCVRNIIIRKSYQPIARASRDEDPTIAAIRDGRCTADELLSYYCKSLHERLGSYAATSRVVGLDQRTVKRHVDRE